MTPVISIVGRSKTGKTTLLEKLLVELKSRGYRIATVKHTPMGASLSGGDKDSERHLKAGSDTVVVAEPNRLVLIKPLNESPTLERIARLLGTGFDLIITEGFKQDTAPKIEVHRKSVAPPLKDINNIVAIATDEPLHGAAKEFALDDVKGIANLIEMNYLNKSGHDL
ncbi:MAG TPA: molybdopterin-guanine dinucleotide biosynthesis protein B [Dehalococcoidales bacterium]|nr:molybdopterin-guanine dinucleotide biosynthesis protein B [Dehalococcoidales bacterium]